MTGKDTPRGSDQEPVGTTSEPDDGQTPIETSPRTIVVRMECADCEEEIDTTTRRHQRTDSDCDLAARELPDDRVVVNLHCPQCDSRELYEVNVGEVWDAIDEIEIRDGTLLVAVHQDASMDREGAGYVCGSCNTRLDGPVTDLHVEWSYM